MLRKIEEGKYYRAQADGEVILVIKIVGLVVRYRSTDSPWTWKTSDEACIKLFVNEIAKAKGILILGELSE